MKLRISFFNPTVFKKDLTRFAPTWALYTVGLFMMLAVCMDATYNYSQAENMAATLGFMAVLNLGYGLLNGQLLFGDLFSARHCNALHAMPLRRECWFITHTVSGFLFSFVPNLAMSLVAALILKGGWVAAAMWLAAVTMQYVFFFGLAVLSAMCVGNRFAMVLLYGIISFLSLIIYWFYYSIYEPLLYGVFCNHESFTLFCPVWELAGNGYKLVGITADKRVLTYRDFALGEGWGYLSICAVIGVGLLALALLLYRRRKLESAGDFMAVRPLEPVFLGLYTMSMATFFQMFAELFEQSEYIFLGLGMIIGFFTGLMLIRRTIRVFQPKAVLAFLLVCAVFAGSMVMTAADVVGVTRYVPKTEQVASVTITPSQYNYNYSGVQLMEEPENIEKAVALHEAILAGKTTAAPLEDDTAVCITYVLNNGKTLRRYYTGIDTNSEAGQLIAYFYNRTEYILNGKPEDVLNGLQNVYFNDYEKGHSANLPAHIGRGLLKAAIADCEAGLMTQHWAYMQENTTIAWVEFNWVDDNGREYYNSLEVFQASANTIAYLEETVYPWLAENSY